jgi:hypothetical protein
MDGGEMHRQARLDEQDHLRHFVPNSKLDGKGNQPPGGVTVRGTLADRERTILSKRCEERNGRWGHTYSGTSSGNHATLAFREVR